MRPTHAPGKQSSRSRQKPIAEVIGLHNITRAYFTLTPGIFLPCSSTMSQLYFSAISWLAFVSTGSLSAGQEPVYFSLIVSGGENGYRSTGGIPSVDLALEAVQKNQLLPGYNLTYDKIRNSKVILDS